MDAVSLASGAATAQRAQTAQALAAVMVKMANEQSLALVSMIEAAAEAGKTRNAEVAASAGIVDFRA